MSEYIGRYREPFELKASAKENLDGRWLVAIAVTVVSWLITSAFTSNDGASALVRYAWEDGRIAKMVADKSSFNNMMSIVSLIIGGSIEFGVASYFLKLARHEPAEFSEMFSGFSLFKTNFILNLLIMIFTLLWMLLFIIPGIVAGISYSMAFYILKDNPEIGAMEAIRKSKEMMRGHKMRYFSFVLTFFGWFLLGIVTIGLGMLYVAPYFRAAEANFYLDLKENYRALTDAQ